ncbi:hypothetical protein ACTOJ1_000681 [Shigella flexneri]
MSDDKKTKINGIFKNGSKEEIKKMIMEETGINKNPALAGKGVFLLTVVVDGLTDLRHREKFDFNIDSYNEYLELEKLIELTKHMKLPLEDVFKVKNYLEHIPNFDKNKTVFEQRSIVRDHHARIKESVRLVGF